MSLVAADVRRLHRLRIADCRLFRVSLLTSAATTKDALCFTFHVSRFTHHVLQNHDIHTSRAGHSLLAMSARPVKRTNRKPRFFWQGVLILAPMLVLAKLGALAIWQDKRMAEHEANLRAQELAEEAAGKLAFEWTAHPPSGADAFRVNATGELLEPKPLRQPTPADVTALSAAQSALLHRARLAEFAGTNRGEAIALFRELLEATPPAPVAQQTRYSLALLHQQDGDAVKATAMFQELLNDSTPAFGDAGGDLKTLSLLKLAMLNGNGFDRVCSNAVVNPTPLSAQMLRFIFENARGDGRQNARAWWDVWQRDELKRRVWRSLADRILPRETVMARAVSFTNAPRLVVGDAPPQQGKRISGLNNVATVMVPGTRAESQSPRRESYWTESFDETEFTTAIDGKVWPSPPLFSGRVDTARLIEVAGQTNGHLLRFWTASTLGTWARERVETLRAPQYFGVSVSLAERDVIRPEDLPAVIESGGGKGAGRIWVETRRTNAPPVLATATRADHDGPVILARVHLIGPDLLFEQQNARRFWFQLVITVAALTSIFGFVSAYRAFHKQLRLAELKSNFVSSVSHELRAPIASVRLMAEGLERGKISDPAKQHEYFRFITQECRRLSSMIENVLDFARIEQGRKEYEFEPTDVRALVAQTVKLMEPYAAERGVGLRIADCGLQIGEAGALVADLDGAAIQQALVNLIDNAIKHSPNGAEVAIALDLPNPQFAIRNLQLSVSDHGPGIPAHEHEKIFERFYRLGSELRRETPGVGIGLSIVKHIVEAHGGRVRLESDVGKGSTFTIELPLNVPPASCREAASSSRNAVDDASDRERDGTSARQDAGGTL